MLAAIDLVALPGWWFFWPTLVWGCLLALHYFYVKSAHMGAIPGLKEYLSEFTSEKAWGPDGYLAEARATGS